MISPTRLNRKYRLYSRRRLVRSRSRQVQNRLPMNATVAATTVEIVFATSVGVPLKQAR